MHAHIGVKDMKKQAFIHSFHSQVCRTLQKLDEPDFLMAFDSHLDVFMGVKDVVECMPRRIRLAAGRASSHFLIRRALGDLPISLKAEGLPSDFLPEMILVVPKISLNSYALNLAEKMQDIILGGALLPYQIGDPLEACQSYLSEVLGVKVFTSPPKNLMKLVGMLREAKYTILDLDIDYLREMQAECYTPIEHAEPSQLGLTANLIRFIRKTKPQVITVSEVRVVATQEPKSNFSRFLDCLKNLGYQINYELIFDNDREAERLIEVYKDFYETVQKPLERKQRMESDFLGKGAISRHIKQLKEATKQYFRQMRGRLS